MRILLRVILLAMAATLVVPTVGCGKKEKPSEEQKLPDVPPGTRGQNKEMPGVTPK